MCPLSSCLSVYKNPFIFDAVRRQFSSLNHRATNKTSHVEKASICVCILSKKYNFILGVGCRALAILSLTQSYMLCDFYLSIINRVAVSQSGTLSQCVNYLLWLCQKTFCPTPSHSVPFRLPLQYIRAFDSIYPSII